MPQTELPKQKNKGTHEEHILVVKRTDLLPDGGWHGIKPVDFDSYLQIIEEKKEFLPRSAMEVDPNYKQIIPYLVFTHNNRYFLMQRRATASEARLRNKYSLGIGGHIRQEDMSNNSIFDWARREFHEEVAYEGSFEIEPIGLLNDDSNSVGQVHIGFVFLLKGDSDKISIRSELKSGSLVTVGECALYQESLENWSKEVLNFLTQ